jgi:hypothetical protein
MIIFLLFHLTQVDLLLFRSSISFCTISGRIV